MGTDTRSAIGRLSAAVGKEIRKRLIDLDMTQVQLAAKIGENEMWMSRRLRGAQPIDLNDLERIADVLDIDVTDLLPQREGRLITVGGAPRPTPRGDLTTAHSPLAKRSGTHSPRGRVARPLKGRTGRIDANLVTA
jgi:transcriptional regulator with XRE-family HTH domain